eukprot:2769297-Pyramimonas_sp.AAC.1
MLRQWNIPITVCRQSLGTTLTDHVLEHCFYSATTTLVFHGSTTVRNQSYSTTTDALQFDGIHTTSEYDSSGLFVLRQYNATTKPFARV